MTCPRCNSQNVTVTVEQTNSKTRKRKRGIMWTLGRWTLIFCTLGLWLIVGRSSGKEKTKINNNTVAICQNCGNKWVISHT